jgi:hypothetical protein
MALSTQIYIFGDGKQSNQCLIIFGRCRYFWLYICSNNTKFHHIWYQNAPAYRDNSLHLNLLHRSQLSDRATAGTARVRPLVSMLKSCFSLPLTKLTDKLVCSWQAFLSLARSYLVEWSTLQCLNLNVSIWLKRYDSYKHFNLFFHEDKTDKFVILTPMACIINMCDNKIDSFSASIIDV